MKFRKDKDILKFIGISLSAILFGILIFLSFQSMSIFGFILILGGLIGFLIALNVASKPRQDLIEDERSVRNAEKAGYHAFLILIFIAAIIILLRMLKLSPSLTPSGELFDAAQSMYLIGLFAYVALNWHYNRKGEA